MARSDLKKRLEALEAKTAEGKAWHVIVVRRGQTPEQARTEYEERNDRSGTVIRRCFPSSSTRAADGDCTVAACARSLARRAAQQVIA